MTRPEMTTGRFWAATAERAVKTAAQTAVALIGTGAVGVLDVDWQQILSVSALAGVVSVLTSLASDRLGPDGGPSLMGEAVMVEVHPEFLPTVEVPTPRADTMAPLSSRSPAEVTLAAFTGGGGPDPADEAELAARRAGGAL